MHILGHRHKTKRNKPLLKKVLNRRVTLLDKITFVTGILGPLTVLPQIYVLYTTRDASGISLLSWILMFAMTLPWIFYGIVHKDKTITASYILWEIVNLAVIIGIVLYQ